MKKFRALRKAAVKRIAPPDLPEKGSLVYWRAAILFSILVAGLLLGVFAVIAGVNLTVREQAWGLVLCDLFGYALGLFFLFSRRLKYAARQPGV